MILGRTWIDPGAWNFPVDTRVSNVRCKDPKCPSLKRYPHHYHDGSLAVADPDLEGDSA